MIEISEENNYFDHDADIGIIGRGKTVEKSFEQAAYVVFAIMSDLSNINSSLTEKIEFEEEDLELALVTWLNLLIAKAYEKNCVFAHFHLTRNNNHWQGEASGEPWTASMEHGIEVKGATLTMLSVKEVKDHWEARCVVDV